MMNSTSSLLLVLVVIGAVVAVTDARSLLAVTTSTTEVPADEETVDSTDENEVDVPPFIHKLHIDSEIRARYATTLVSSRIGNPNRRKSQEVHFSIVLPETAFISRFLMIIDGVSYEAYVKEKDEAKRVYDEAVKQGITAGHVSVSPRDSSKFQVSVNVAAQQKVTFNLTYEELLTRKLGAYEQAITVDAGQIVPDLRVKACVYEVFNLTKLKIPTIRSADENDVTNTENKIAVIDMLSGSSACITYEPSEVQQKEMSEQGIAGQFLVQYDIERKQDAGEIYVLDGYFVHFFSPPELKPLRKHLVFVLDHSGSMYGRRIEQLKEAMTRILSDLTPGDRFNIIQFSSGVESWNPETNYSAVVDQDTYHWRQEYPKIPEDAKREAYPATPENIEKAKEFVASMKATGGTNIHDALIEGLRYASIDTSDEDGRPEPLLVFLTDGEPTVGITGVEEITSKVTDANSGNPVPLFSLAFGTGADFNFLKRLSLKNGAFARKIYEASDAALQLKGFYAEIASPLLSNVTFQYLDDEVEKTTLTKGQFGTYFAGSELVVAGKLRSRDNTDSPLTASVSGLSSNGHLELSSIRVPPPCFLYPQPIPFLHTDHSEEPATTTDVITDETSTEPSSDPSATVVSVWEYPECPPTIIIQTPRPTDPPTRAQKFVERLWAYLTIRQLLDKQEALDKTTTTTPAPQVTSTTESGTTDEPATTLEAVAETTTIPAMKTLSPKETAVHLALRYGFVTPVTSLVVVKPNKTDDKPVDAIPVDEDFDEIVPMKLSPSPRVGGGSCRNCRQYAMSYAPRARPALRLPSVPGPPAPPALYGPSFDAYDDTMTMSLSLPVDRQRGLPGFPGHPGVNNRIAGGGPAGYPGYAGYPGSAGYSGYGFSAASGGAYGAPYPHLQGPLTTPRPFYRPSTTYVQSSTRTSSAESVSLEEETAYELTTEKEHLDLSAIKWLSEKLLDDDQLQLPLGPFTVAAANQTDEAYQPCGVPVGSGECRHLRYCVQEEFVDDFDVYYQKYLCTIDNTYVGVCCPL